MSEKGWRTLVIQSGGELRLDDNQIVLEGDKDICVPLDQIARIIIAKPSVMISSALLVEMASRHIKVILCDHRYLPACELEGIGLHNNAAGMMMDQVGWLAEAKDKTWAHIVRAKIHMQSNLLANLDLSPAVSLTSYADELSAGDPTNREAMAARVYFSALFGRGFHRNTGGNLNAALNYGYAILLSEFSRMLAAHGYRTELGIHHCRRDNQMNLSCDLMEPFRPFVDALVRANGDRPLDWGYKKQLISVVHAMCRYGAKRMDLSTAIEEYTLDVMRTMENGTNQIKEIDFAEQIWRRDGVV